MAGLSSVDVEAWVETHPDWFHDYIMKKADVHVINKWLTTHGFSSVQEVNCRRESSNSGGLWSPDSSGHTSPDPRGCDSGFFSENSRHQRSNSKKHLRQDFARSKLRNIFRTHEPSFSLEKEATLAERRSSLKGMRQFLSLPPTSGSMLSVLIQSKVRLPRYASKDEEHKRKLRHTSERDFFLEIVRDISHELDIKTLTTRIVVNISILLNAERSSLFFVEGPKGKQTLVSKVFDICVGSNCLPTAKGDNIVRIPWGEGIIGHVAESGQSVNIRNPKEDPRYQNDIDMTYGYLTMGLLCMAIRNADGEVIGVAQVINKNTDDACFTKDDEMLLETYLAFCGMAISNAQAIESYTTEYDRNKALLEVVHDLFEEQTSVEGVVMKIMQRAQTLLRCERCVVMLKDKDEKPETSGFGRIFDLHQPQELIKNGQLKSSSANDLDMGHPTQIAEIVARTGETVNIADARYEPQYQLAKGKSDTFHTKSILCKPIRNNSCQTIGVAQLINKLDGDPFDENDDELFEAFTIFCGLGINNCLLYDEVCRSAAKQAVALEVLSYHATAADDDMYLFKRKAIPDPSKWRINQLDFNDFCLDVDQMVMASIGIFDGCGFLKKFKIESETLIRWLLTVRKNYRNIAYHNWRHAFNVCQFMFTLLTTCNLRSHLEDLECLALIVACLCHDLDHRGTNNAFQQKSSSPLSQLYGTQATLEHHHFNHAVIILNSEGNNIFGNLTSKEYGHVMKLLKHAIIATDISFHIQVRQKFFPLVESGDFSWEITDQREMLRNIMMTTCDIASITKPWDVQRRVAHLVVTEFLNQGDKEKEMLNIQPLAYMDREKKDELPKLQMQWIDGVCLPLYKALYKMDPQFKPLMDNVIGNRQNWETLDQQRINQGMVKQTAV